MNIMDKAILDKYREHPALFMLGAVALGILISALVIISHNFLWPVVVASALLIVWIMLNNPDLGLAILVFLTYTRFSDVLQHQHGVPSFTLQLALLLLAILAWRWWVWGERIHNWETPAILLGFYGLVGFTSLLYAADPGRTQNALVEFAKGSLLLFTVILALRRKESLRYTVWALLAAGIFMATLTVYQQLTGTFTNTYGGFAQTEVKNIVGAVSDYRVSGPVGSTNYYALILVALVPLALDRLWHEEKTLLRILALWALIACTLSVIFTFSRGGFLALIVVWVLMLVRHSFSPARMAMGLALLFVVWQFIPANYTERMTTTLNLLPGSEQDIRSEVSFRGRTSEVLVAWQIFADRPLWGVGLNNYKHYYQEYAQPLGWDNRREERSAHSLYLEIAAETGLIGLAAFSAIIGVAFWRAHGARQSFMRAGQYDEAALIWALAVSLIGYLVASLFLHGAYPRFFWLWIGIMLALSQVAATQAAPVRQRFKAPISHLTTRTLHAE